MKKIIAVLLALCLCAGLLPAAFADEASLVDTYLELSHKVYKANTADALFAAHKSVSYAYSCPPVETLGGFEYYTADSRYAEWGLNEAAYFKDRLYYQMYHDAETGALSLSCGANVNRDVQIHFMFSSVAEEDFVDLEHDKPIDIFEEDGLLHIRSQYDEKLSREWFEDYLSLKYEGQIVYDETVVDPESYELVQAVVSAELNGETQVLYIQTAEYDLPEPVASRTLRAAFERSSENMMNLTMVADPGTDHELSVSYSAPVNSECVYFYDGTAAIFDDPEGTTVSHWDRMSDHTWYILTDLDEAAMAKYETMLAELKNTPAA